MGMTYSGIAGEAEMSADLDADQGSRRRLSQLSRNHTKNVEFLAKRGL
jgi:hypothetical protein